MLLKISDVIKKKTGFLCMGGVDERTIEYAEIELGLEFSTDYKDLLRNTGPCSFEGHELTGLGGSRRLDVVEVTRKAKMNNIVPDNFYVIEETNIDGEIIWQTANGGIYETTTGSEPERLADSIEQFLSDA